VEELAKRLLVDSKFKGVGLTKAVLLTEETSIGLELLEKNADLLGNGVGGVVKTCLVIASVGVASIERVGVVAAMLEAEAALEEPIVAWLELICAAEVSSEVGSEGKSGAELWREELVVVVVLVVGYGFGGIGIKNMN